MEAKIKKKFEEMESDLFSVLKELEGRDEFILNQAPQPGKWSIVQILHHLMEVEIGTLMYIKKKTQSPENLEKSGFTEWWKSGILNFYLKAPIKWKAPKSVDTVPDTDSFENTTARFKKTRASWNEFLSSMPEDWAGKKIFRHPTTGRMNLFQTLRFIDLHAKRHYKQIRKILEGAS